MEDTILLTDTHCHLNYIDVDKINDTVLRAYAVGVKRMITIGTDYQKSISAINIAEQYPNIFASVGVHPSDSTGYKSSDYDKFLKLADNKNVIAIGEIGLDFYRDHAPRAVQEKVFAEFINLAIDLKKPIIIHNRDSSIRLIEILSSELSLENYGGIIHCFNGDKVILDWAIRNKFYISIAGQVTYKSAENIRDTLKHIPIERLLVETDSPYLTPDVMRKQKKDNEPSFVKYTFDFVADEIGIDKLTLAKQLDLNFNTLFHIDRGLYE